MTMIKVNEEMKNIRQKHYDFDFTYLGGQVTTSERYISDLLIEVADANVDIYNRDLLNWLSEDFNNANYIDEYVKEFGDTRSFDLFDSIRGGQYLKAYEYLNNNIEEAITYLFLDCLYDNGIEEIDELVYNSLTRDLYDNVVDLDKISNEIVMEIYNDYVSLYE